MFPVCFVLRLRRKGFLTAHHGVLTAVSDFARCVAHSKSGAHVIARSALLSLHGSLEHMHKQRGAAKIFARVDTARIGDAALHRLTWSAMRNENAEATAMMRHAVQALVTDEVRDRLDSLRRERKPIGSAADLLREVIDLGITAYEKQQARKREKAAAS
jgi:hypothetical protein